MAKERKPRAKKEKAEKVKSPKGPTRAETKQARRDMLKAVKSDVSANIHEPKVVFVEAGQFFMLTFKLGVKAKNDKGTLLIDGQEVKLPIPLDCVVV
jgi:hypothetical protein